MAAIPAGHLEQQPDDPIVLFQAADGKVSLDARLEADTVWLSQAQMAELFGRERSVISKLICNVFKEGELEPISTCAKYAKVQTEGSRLIQRQVDFYNLDVIISVGYRVKSARGTQFRIWATQVLRQHLIQGYKLHQRRLQERGLGDLQQALALMARTLSARGLVSDEGQPPPKRMALGTAIATRWLPCCPALHYPLLGLRPLERPPAAAPKLVGNWLKRHHAQRRRL
jgi:hypothetical protein